MPKTAFKVGMSRFFFLQFLFSSIHAGQKIGENHCKNIAPRIYMLGREILFSVTIFFFVIKMKKIKMG